MSFSYTKKINFSFIEALDEVRLAFSEKWFWVVSNIDIAEKIRKTVDSNFWEYTVFWICNPELAYKFLSESMDLGVFMPCSVAIYEKDGSVFISAWLPDKMISWVIDSNNLDELSNSISKTMKEVIYSI